MPRIARRPCSRPCARRFARPGNGSGSLADLFDVYQDNLRLKEQNARLRQWQTTALALQQRLNRYQLLLHAVPDPAVGSVTAHVIGRAQPSLSRTP